MDKLIAELTRLYLPTGTFSPDVLEQHMLGHATLSISLVTNDSMTRAVAIPFHKLPGGDGEQHWTLLCQVANALQSELGLPAPAVSISGAHGYGLWLSLETPAPTTLVQRFLELLHANYFPAMELRRDAVMAAVELPPCRHQDTGRWAAFIHPGLGASFADESGLDMAPPLPGQAALLEGLHSISEQQFMEALEKMGNALVTPQVSSASPPQAAAAGLLLKDASLEDIVRHLHSIHIEPTFRHLIRP